MKAIHIAFLCLVFVGSEAKVIQKCELYNMLKEMGVKDYFGFDVQHLVCVALFSSEGNTEFYENENGVPYYGIFRLSGLEWCFNGRHLSDNKCDMECDKFLDNHINDDVQCAKEIIASNAFGSWPRYQELCSKNWVDIINLVCTHGLHSEVWLSNMKNKHKRDTIQLSYQAAQSYWALTLADHVVCHHKSQCSAVSMCYCGVLWTCWRK